MSNVRKIAVLRASMTMAIVLLTAFTALAQDQRKTEDQLETPQNQELTLVSKDTAITAVVGEEDGEGLWMVTTDGTNYAVVPPDTVSFEALENFQRTYVNKQVTLTGDVFKDRYGNLSVFVKSLPK